MIGLDNLTTGSRRNIEGFEPLTKQFSFVFGDIRDDVRAWVERADVVFHLAALGSVPRSIASPEDTHDSNVNGFFNLLNTTRKLAKPPHIVFASSSSVYGDIAAIRKIEPVTGTPLSPYAASKRINEVYAEAFARAYSLSLVGLRFFNVFGPNQNPGSPYSAVIPKWTKAMLTGKGVEIYGSGNRWRDFTPVSYAVDALMLAADRRTTGEAEFYNVGCGKLTSLLELYDKLKGLTGYEGEAKFLPTRSGDIERAVADLTASELRLGYRPELTDDAFDGFLKEVVESIRKETHVG